MSKKQVLTLIVVQISGEKFMMSGIFTEDPRIVWFWLHYLFRCNSHYARTCCILLKKETDGGEKYCTAVYGNVI